MKKLIGLFILCLLFGGMGGCREKTYTLAEVNVMIGKAVEQGLMDYQTSKEFATLLDDRFVDGQNTEKLLSSQELQKLIKELQEKLNEYKK